MQGGMPFGGYSSISPQIIPPTSTTQLPTMQYAACSMQHTFVVFWYSDRRWSILELMDPFEF
jgi:hypothetical protein